MQKHSPNNKSVEIEDINVNSVDSMHSNGHFIAGHNVSRAGSECNDDKSIDACSSDDESHELDNAEQENQATYIDGSNRGNFKGMAVKKKKSKTVKVKFTGSQDDKSGIKLKIRRTNNFNQDENHVIVDNAEQQRKRHLKNKRCKSISHDELIKVKLEEMSKNGGSDDSSSHKRSKNESDDESKVSIGINTTSKGTNTDDACLGLCQAGTRLSIESVVLMETKSGILIVSVQWRGKTLMGALMESERFQIGSIEKDSIYRREKLSAMNRRNTRRKSKNIYGKKKRKLTTPTDSGEHAGTENEAGNSDIENPYICDKENCHMKFADFQALRIHIYQKHRVKGDCVRSFPSDPLQRSSIQNHQTKHSLPDLVKPEHHHPTATNGTNLSSEERNTFSPAYSDISDANEAPVLENEAELKPTSVSVAQPPINLSLCHNPALLAASNRMLFSPTAPALQPEVSLGSSQPPHLRLPSHHDGKLPHLANYRLPISADPSGIMNGFLPPALHSNHKQPPPNGTLSLSSACNIPAVSDMGLNSIQDLSVTGPFLNATNYHHKVAHKLSSSSSDHHQSNNHHHRTAPTLLNCHSKQQQPSPANNNRHNIHAHHIHSSNTSSINNGHLMTAANSKHPMSLDNGLPNQPPSNGVPLSHSYPYVSFSQSVNNNPNSKFNFPINPLTLYTQPKF